MKDLSVSYGDTVIHFQVVYSPRRKTVEIAVEPPGKVTVTAPEGRSDDDLVDAVSRKADWIIKKLYQMKAVRFQPVVRELVNGESLLYMGRNYRLDLRVDDSLRQPDIILDHGIFKITTPSLDQEYLRSKLISWYRRKAMPKILMRIEYFAPRLGVKVPDVRIKDQKKRWGSCTPSGNLYFNWRCILAPAPVIDYIVVHELCHLLENSHSKRFWGLLKAAIPNYEGRKQWLMENGIKLDL